MSEDDKIIPQHGPFKGKEIRFAPRNGVNIFFEVSEDSSSQVWHSIIVDGTLRTYP